MASDFVVATTYTRPHGRKLQKKNSPRKYSFLRVFYFNRRMSLTLKFDKHFPALCGACEKVTSEALCGV